jgi:hypothetical protein
MISAWWLIVIFGGVFLYSFHLKDVYYGYGRANALIWDLKCKVEQGKDGSLRFISPVGKGTESYVGYLGKSVGKLLRKDGTLK